MEIRDRIYGVVNINEQVLIDLINSPSIQRLKGIAQFGIPDEYHYLKGFSRYEHSLGVMLLLRKLGASIEEQIAGLLHDVSHTAFSHVIDWVVGDSVEENHQDDALISFIDRSELPEILSKNGLDHRKVTDFHSFSLLEQKAPDICADRVDYALREFSRYGVDETSIVDALIVIDGKMVFQNEAAAKVFAETYARCNRDNWYSQECKARYHILADILKEALERNIIEYEDFWKTDEELLGILKQISNPKIDKGLQMLRHGFRIEESSEEGALVIKKKFRYVDPLVFCDQGLRRLSEISFDYKSLLDDEKNKIGEGESIKIVEK